MTDIRSLLSNSQKLESFGQALHQFTDSTTKVVSSDIASSVRQLHGSVDRKVVDLYKNILNNFNRTVLPIEPNKQPNIESKDRQLLVENKKEQLNPTLLVNRDDNRELVSLRKKKIEVRKREPLGVGVMGAGKENKENKENAEKQPEIQANKAKICPADEKKTFIEYRDDRPRSPVLPRLRQNLSPRKKHETHSAKPSKTLPAQSNFRHPQQQPLRSSKQLFNEKALLEKLTSITFEIRSHQLDDSSLQFLDFQRQNYQIWDMLSLTITKLLQFSEQNNLPNSRVDARKLVGLAKQKPPYKQMDFLNCFENVDKLLQECNSKKLRYYGKVGRMRAIVRIQAWVRMRKQRIQYGKMLEVLKRILVIQRMWRCHQQLKKTRRTLRQNSLKLIERFENRQAIFKKNWQQIKLENRVEIHINSMSVAEIKRLTTEKFLQKQNCQISRIFKLKDPNLSIIYICPFALSPEVIAYYNKALEISQIYDARSRLMFVWPQTRFSDHSCLCENTLYSPEMLRRINSLIRHKTCYLVPGNPSNTYLRIADLLNIPIYGGLPSKSQYLSSKTGCRILSQKLLPCQMNIYSRGQLLKALTELVVRYPNTHRWVFKAEDERGSRGNAYIDVKTMKSVRRIRAITNIRQDSDQYKSVYSELQSKLPHKLRTVHKNLFNSFEQYLMSFLSSGGIIEASPNCPESKLKSSTFILDIEPNGKWTLLNSYDKIMWHMKPIGCQYPSEMKPPMDEIEMIARKVYREGVCGYVSVDYLGEEGREWFIGTDCFLNNMACIYFTASSVSQYCLAPTSTSTPTPTTPLSFLYCPFIIHPGLSSLQLKSFFHLCRLANISFDIIRRIGSIFIFTDSLQSGTIGLMSFCDNKYGLYKYIVNALEFLSNRLESGQQGIVDNPRTDYITFQEVKNTFKTIIRRMERERTVNTMKDLVD